jgi:hypothetical protein
LQFAEQRLEGRFLPLLELDALEPADTIRLSSVSHLGRGGKRLAGFQQPLQRIQFLVQQPHPLAKRLVRQGVGFGERHQQERSIADRNHSGWHDPAPFLGVDELVVQNARSLVGPYSQPTRTSWCVHRPPTIAAGPDGQHVVDGPARPVFRVHQETEQIFHGA